MDVDGRFVRWNFSPECIVTSVISPECIAVNDDGDQEPESVISVVGNSITFDYSDGGMNPGNTFRCFSQPGCVTVPGGTFTTPGSGTMG